MVEGEKEETCQSRDLRVATCHRRGAASRASFFSPSLSPTMPKAKGTSNSPMRQPMISSFFSQSPTSQAKASKRHTPPPDERPSKKQKTTQQPLFLPGSPPPDSDLGSQSTQKPARSTERWRYDSILSLDDPRLEVSPEEQASRDNLRAMLSKKLVIENNTSRRQDSDTLEDPDDSDKDEADEEEQGSGASDDDSDSQFRALQEMFSHSKGKDKAKATGGKKAAKARGKTGETGPSGKPYTPLEQQVSTMQLCMAY